MDAPHAVSKIIQTLDEYLINPSVRIILLTACPSEGLSCVNGNAGH